MRAAFQTLMAIALTFFGAGCGPSSDGTAGSDGAPAPSGEFAAATISTGVTWSIQEGSAGGTITTGGLYTAPTVTASSTFHVVVRSSADSSRTATATVTVSPAAQTITLTVAPGSASILTGATQQFTATVTGTTNTTVSWSVQEGSAGGGVSSTGLYTAPSAAGTYHVRATAAVNGAVATATVVVSDPLPGGDPLAILPADRRTTWDPGIPGGIPAVTTVFRTIDAAYGNNSTDATSVINSAITAAGAVATDTNRQVVYLPAGTYRVTAVQLNQNNVVLRGAGPSSTRIIGTGGAAAVRIGGRYSYGSAINLTATAPKGATSITLSDASSINVGDVLQIDQQDGPATDTGDGHFWNGYLWMADGHYSKRQPTSDAHGPGFGGTQWGGSGTWLQITNWNAQNSGPWRSVAQQIEVTAKSGNTLTLRDPLHLAFELARVPQVFKTVSPRQADGQGTRYAGLEDVAVTGGGNDNIQLMNVAYCWLKHVESDGESISGDSTHPGMTGRSVQLFHAYRCVVRDSYVHHARNIVNGGGAYGVAVEDGSSANLIENNIMVWLNKPVVMNVSGGGNVVAYNYVDNAMINGSAWQENALDGCHQAFSHHDLFEGNWAPNLGSDSTHGSAGWHVFFRNYATGRNGIPYNIGSGTGLPTQNLRAAGVDALSREHTFVGNVLQSAGVGTSYYEATPSNHPSGSPIYRLGDNGNGGSGGSWDAGQALSFTYRHGNWDSVSNAVVWDAGNSVRTLPASLYLKVKPAFFGSNPWPWVDPTASTRVNVLPAKARFDAGTPNG